MLCPLVTSSQEASRSWVLFLEDKRLGTLLMPLQEACTRSRRYLVTCCQYTPTVIQTKILLKLTIDDFF